MSLSPKAKLSIDDGMLGMHHHSQWSAPYDTSPTTDVRYVDRQASHGYGQLSYPTYPSHPTDTGMNFAILKRFVSNQRVNVNIEGCGWVVGTVVAIITTVKSLTGTFVRVRYSLPHDHRERMAEVPDDPRYIHPF